MSLHEYTFDLQLRAAISVNAESPGQAQLMLIKHLDCAQANFGAWSNGDPILGEVSLDTREDGTLAIDLGLIDGEEPNLHRADRLMAPEELRAKYHLEHPMFLRWQWREAVTDDSTLLGYWEWVSHQLEEEP